jgi:hypothetical protein
MVEQVEHRRGVGPLRARRVVDGAGRVDLKLVAGDVAQHLGGRDQEVAVLGREQVAKGRLGEIWRAISAAVVPRGTSRVAPSGKVI